MNRVIWNNVLFDEDEEKVITFTFLSAILY